MICNRFNRHQWLSVVVVLMATISGYADEAKEILRLTTPGAVKWLVFSPDGKTLLTASNVSDRGKADGQELRLWDTTTGKMRAGPVKSSFIATAGAISADGKLAATGSHDSSWQVWSLADLKPITKGQLDDGRIHRIAFSPDGKTIGLLRADYRRLPADAMKANRVTYTAHSFDVNTGKAVGDRQLWPREHFKDEAPIEARTSDPAGWSQGMSPSFGKDRLLVLPTAREAIALEVPGDVENSGGPGASAISPDRKWAVSSGTHGTVVLWDFVTGKIVGEPLLKAENLQVMGNALIFTPKSNRLAIIRKVAHSSPDHYQPIIYVYDVASRKQFGQSFKPGKVADVDAIAFAPNGDRLVVACQMLALGDKPGPHEIRFYKIDADNK